MMYYTDYNALIGRLRLESNGDSLTGLCFEKRKYNTANSFENMIKKDELTVFRKTVEWLNVYFCGQKPPKIDVNLQPDGGKFRQEVWKILCDIPYGKVITYGDIAKKFNKRMSAQAIGGAVAHNPIAIIIPCHRVIGANGKLTGYAAGLDMKIKLLKIEHAYKDSFRV